MALQTSEIWTIRSSLLLSMRVLVTTVIWHMLVTRFSPRFGLVKLNFANKPVMASYGLIMFPYITALSVIFTAWGWVSWAHVRLYLGAMAAMWALGAIDDIWGTREVGGFKGHFKKLLIEKRVTTGAVKAIGGGLVALAAGFSIYGHNIPRALIAAAVIALSANLLNLFDLRPGRALAVIFIGLGVTCIMKCGRMVAWPLVGAIAAIALLFGIADSRGKAMMGDSGSNSLGAALGLTIVLNSPNWMLPAIAIMAAIHIYSEKHSISGLIERNRVLRAIDRCLGVR